MRVTRIRKFKRSRLSEITLRVSSKESEQICHAINCMQHKVQDGYPELQKAGLKLLESLSSCGVETPKGVFWSTW